MQYIPHAYQQYAIDFIESHPIAAVILDMGLGKTSVTLTAIAWFTADLPAAIRAAGSALPHSTAAGRILRVYEAVFGRLHLRVARRGVACRRTVACRAMTLLSSVRSATLRGSRGSCRLPVGSRLPGRAASPDG